MPVFISYAFAFAPSITEKTLKRPRGNFCRSRQYQINTRWCQPIPKWKNEGMLFL